MNRDPGARLLTLVRHAKSCWRYEGLDDHARPLGRRGLKDCRRVPIHLAGIMDPPDRILSSDAARALQTCEAVAAELGVGEASVELVPDLYLASPREILEVVARRAGDAAHLMLIGHNPGMTELFELLTGEPLDNLPTFGVGHLALDAGADWSRLGPGSARVVELVLPREI